MSDIAIRVENLGKKYIIGHQKQERYTALRDVIVDKVKSIGRRKLETGEQEEFWALKEVEFEIKKGDRVGIIGRNGAGKSTLLKLLSRITEPTTGKIYLNGRVASLLEVGTGFHPELTGRENIYLNGSIIGMSRTEIKKKFDEIVDFAEVEKFLDTPVKRYSSGMYVRLAFAVAAHMEPEILVVDEVLAVGDAQFQKKCLGKMGEVGKEGRTVLFVSHQLSAIELLCPKAILIDRGSILKNDNSHEVINYYSELGGENGEIYRRITSKLKWLGIQQKKRNETFKPDDDICFLLKFKAGKENINGLFIDFAIFNENNYNIIHIKSKFINRGFNVKQNENFHIFTKVNSPKLAPGKYRLTVYVYAGNEELLWIDNIYAFTVLPINYFGISNIFDEIKSPIIPEFKIEIL